MSQTPNSLPRIAYELQGTAGPWVVCVPGMGDLRAEYRFLASELVAQGFRVALLDVRGHGEAPVDFDDFSPRAVGEDLLQLLRSLDGPAFIVGTSFAAAAAVWAAAEAPERVLGLVLCGPFVRDLPQNPLMPLLLAAMLAPPWGVSAWLAYYRSLYPSRRPADFDAYTSALRRNLAEPGRMAALRAMTRASKAPCEARLAEVTAPTLVVMGTRDPDFPDPAAEARSVAERLRGEALMVEGAGHYPHAEMPEVVGPRLVEFLRRCADAAPRA